jgi:hypothetical protein
MKEGRARRQLSLSPFPLPSIPCSKVQLSDSLRGSNSNITEAKNAGTGYTGQRWNHKQPPAILPISHRRSGAESSHMNPCFDLWAVRVGFVVDKVIFIQTFLGVHCSSSASHHSLDISLTSSPAVFIWAKQATVLSSHRPLSAFYLRPRSPVLTYPLAAISPWYDRRMRVYYWQIKSLYTIQLYLFEM